MASDGSVWLATVNYGNGPSGIVHIDTHGAQHRFERLESFNRVTLDASGNAWFTVGAGSAGQQPKLVRVDAAGHMRDYPLPPEGNFQGIALGPDHAVWFANASDGEVGRIAADGKITYYGPATRDPTEITAGSDGNLWFTENLGNRIGRLNPDGRLNEFVIPTRDSRPAGIALAPDGSLWFCESAGNKIGKITRDGRVSEFRVPTPNAWPVGIAAARDGTIWFTETTAAQIGRIGRDGKVTEYAAPEGGYPGPMARAPSGALWAASNAQRETFAGMMTGRSRVIEFAPGK